MNHFELAEKMRRDGRLSLYSRQCGDPKSDAQRNLSGRTHYVDADTLRYHKSRIVGANVEGFGLFYRIIESAAIDYQNTRRGFRCVVFDIFGHVVSRVDLEESWRTSEQAYKAFAAWYGAFDIGDYYSRVFSERAARLREEAESLETLARATRLKARAFRNPINGAGHAVFLHLDRLARLLHAGAMLLHPSQN